MAAGSEPYDLDHMTFQQEEELFPTVGADGIPVKEDTNTSVKANADVIAEKDTDNANELIEANGKRKLPEKPVEKKVDSILCLFAYITGLSDCFIFKNLSCGVSQEANQPPDSWFELKVNTHVYVTGLPDDVTFDEVNLYRFDVDSSLFYKVDLYNLVMYSILI